MQMGIKGIKGQPRIGEPPNDGREWVCADEAAKMLHCCRDRAVWRAKKFEWTRYLPADKSQSWILKKDILDWLSFLKMRSDWYRRHRPQHWETQNSTLDVQTAQQYLLTCHEAAEMLGISSDRLVKLANQGKIHVFLTRRIWRESRYWFALQTIKEYQQDSKQQRRKEIYQKGLETRRKRQLGIAPQEPPARHRKLPPLPEGWLTAWQVMELLNVSKASVNSLRRRGYLRAKPLLNKKGERILWIYNPVVVEERLADEEYQQLRRKWEEREAHEFQSQVLVAN